MDPRRGDEGELPAHDRDQDVEATELAGRACHEVVERAGLPHVRGEGDGIGQFRSGLVGSLRIDVGHRDRAPRRAELPRDRPADAAATAADHECCSCPPARSGYSSSFWGRSSVISNHGAFEPT